MLQDALLRTEFLSRYHDLVAGLRTPHGMARLAVRGLDPEAELRRLAAAKEVFMSAAAHYADIEKRLLD